MKVSTNILHWPRAWNHWVKRYLTCRGRLYEGTDLPYLKVIEGCIENLGRLAVEHSFPSSISRELRNLLVCSCHRIANAREIASKYLNRLITSFPSLMCDELLVFSILEVLTMVRNSCEGEFLDEVRNKIHLFTVFFNWLASTTLHTNSILPLQVLSLV